MPTYEYKCKDCGCVSEVFHSMSSAPSVKCEICGANCDKMFSTSGNFVLKGSDWPSQGFRTKDEMKKKNVRMRGKMVERESAGEGVTKLSDVK